jgi:hypothetical protein
MAKHTDQSAGNLETENTSRMLSGLLAEENEFDRRTLWRIGSWGFGAISAVTLALLSSQSSMEWRRDQIVAADLTRQAQQLQTFANESQNERLRLASAIETLNGDRDRMYSRLTVLEKGLDSVGAIARQNSVAASAAGPAFPAPADPQPAPQPQAAAPAVAAATTSIMAKTDKPRADAPAAAQDQSTPPPPAPTVQIPSSMPPGPSPIAAQSTAATSVLASKSIPAPPDTGALKLSEPEKPFLAKIDVLSLPEVPANAMLKAADASADVSSDSPPGTLAVQRTEFAVDVGTANSIGGLRALWYGLLKSNSDLAELRPIIVVKEANTGPGMQLRLAAGPLSDAAAAAKICAALIESRRPCETTVFDGQRLAVKTDEGSPQGAPKPAAPAHRTWHAKKLDPPPPPPKPEPATVSSWFARRNPS